MTAGWPRSWPGPDTGLQFGAPPYWGEAHLALDAVVAYVDDELSAQARTRAQDHLSRCRECGAEVVAQYQARTALRGASTPSAPSSLLHNLRSIPQVAELPSPPAGLAIGADGQFVALLREQPAVLNAPMPAPAARRSPASRRVRLGAGVMVSGLALGALVIGATPSPTGSSGPGAGSPGSVRTAVDAQLELGGIGGAAGTAGSRGSAGSRSSTTSTTPVLAPAQR